MENKKWPHYLSCGLGGGLDVLNASLFYYVGPAEGKETILGSSRPCSLNHIIPDQHFADSGTWISNFSEIKWVGKGKNRYCEPFLASRLDTRIMYFSRRYEDEIDLTRLRQAIDIGRETYEIDIQFFIDGGGDSLVLKPGDAIAESEEQGPFEGGDAQVLEALSGISDSYLVALTVGLDVDTDRFKENIDLLDSRGAYFGRVNLATGEKEDYSLDHLLDFSQLQNSLPCYFLLAENTLVLSEEDLKIPYLSMSHTGVVTYHALKGNFGHQRTYVPWEPTLPSGEKGVIVTPEHQWAYFFDVGMIHELKLELNSRK